MSVDRKRSGNALSPTQRSAVINLGQGALPWINRAFGRKPACPSTWITFITARALVREGVATISISSCGSWLRLTPRGHYYARLLAEAAEAESSHLLVQVLRQPGPRPVPRHAERGHTTGNYSA
jgi:hypothetical protein